MSVRKTTEPEQQAFDTDVDHYPEVKDALRRLLNEGEFEVAYVDRIHIFCQANGELAYRYWEPRADEPLVGIIRPPQ